MEPGFIKADSANLPVVDAEMISHFFISNAKYVSAEIRNIKTQRAGREGYGDDAVCFVQVKRDKETCIVKGKITPEHKIHTTAYSITAVINEKDEEVINCECHSCAASQGGCKHAVAFLLWLHRRSEEPSVTSVQCYWKKSKLAAVGRNATFMSIQELFPSSSTPSLEAKGVNFLSKYLNISKNVDSDSIIARTYSATCLKNVSLFCLMLKFKECTINSSADSFIQFCAQNIIEHDCREVYKQTKEQHKTSKWYEARFARITASKLYEASRCKKIDGTLRETILGAYKIPETDAMRRGHILEDAVAEKIKKQKNIKIQNYGIIIKPEYPIFGASPDRLSSEYCIEIKCPTKEKTVTNYITINNKLREKPWAQMQLQMFLSGKQLGLFCVASPDFEISRDVKIIEVELDENYCKSIMAEATDFWKSAIFDMLN